MTGQEIQLRLDAIVVDLQLDGKGQTVNILFRNAVNVGTVLPLSSSATGVINAGQLSAIQTFLNGIKPEADALELADANYKAKNVSENYAELSQAKGRYVI